MKPTLARIEIYGGRSKNNLILTTTEESAPDALSPCIAEVFGDEGRLPQKANAALIVAAWNSCVEINPSNPIAAAEAMPEIFAALQWAMKKLTGSRYVNQGGYAGHLCPYCSPTTTFTANDAQPETHSKDCGWRKAAEATLKATCKE